MLHDTCSACSAAGDFVGCGFFNSWPGLKRASNAVSETRVTAFFTFAICRIFPTSTGEKFWNGNFLGQNQPNFMRNCTVLTLFPWNARHNVFGRSTWDADLTDVTQSVSLPWHRKWTLHSGSVRYTTEKHTSNAVGVSAPVGSPNISFVSLCSMKNPLNDLLLLSHTYNSLSNAKKTLSVLEILGTASTKKRIGNVALIFNCVAFKNWTSAFKSTGLQHTFER